MSEFVLHLHIDIRTGIKKIWIWILAVLLRDDLISENQSSFVIVPSLSLVWLFATPWTAAHSFHCPSLSPEVCSISCPLHQWCYPTISSLSSPALSLSQQQGLFSSEPALRIRWPKYWSFSSSISPPTEYSGLISFLIDWFDLLSVQGTLKSLLQHHSLKTLILQSSTFFMVQLTFHTWLLVKS